MPDKEQIEATIRATQPKFTNEQVKTAVEAGYDSAVKKRDNDLFQVGRLYVPASNILTKGLHVVCTSTSF